MKSNSSHSYSHEKKVLFSNELTNGINSLNKIKEDLNKFKQHKRSTSVKKSSGVGYAGTPMESMKSIQSKDKALKKEQQFDSQIIEAFDKITKSINHNIDTIDSNRANNLLQYIESSDGLKSILIALLRNESMLDIGSRSSLYQSLLNLIIALAKEPFTAPFLHSNTSDDSSIQQLLKNLKDLAMTFVKLQQYDEEIVESITISLAISEASDCLERGSDLSSIMNIKSSSLPPSNSINSSNSNNTIIAIEERIRSEYVNTLKPQRFDTLDLCGLVDSNLISHSFYKPNSSSSSSSSSSKRPSTVSQLLNISLNPKERMKRIASEFATLSKSLPVELGSSIFIRCDETNMSYLKCLIVGPDDSPYANGMFEFDIFLPADYPNVSPQFLLCTTGRGTVRFNPNLYNCGKVCLSLLGTWSGPGWNPKESTLLQVLVSIQALIFVNEPYFNEPGYESSKNTPYGVQRSEAYNLNIRQHTLKFAIMEQLQKASTHPIFGNIIRDHYAIKKDLIIQQLRHWSLITRNASFDRDMNVVITLLKQLSNQKVEIFETGNQTETSSTLNNTKSDDRENTINSSTSRYSCMDLTSNTSETEVILPMKRKTVIESDIIDLT